MKIYSINLDFREESVKYERERDKRIKKLIILESARKREREKRIWRREVSMQKEVSTLGKLNKFVGLLRIPSKLLSHAALWGEAIEAEEE